MEESGVPSQGQGWLWGLPAFQMPLEVKPLDAIIECEGVGKDVRGLRTEPRRSPPWRGRSVEEEERGLGSKCLLTPLTTRRALRASDVDLDTR